MNKKFSSIVIFSILFSSIITLLEFLLVYLSGSFISPNYKWDFYSLITLVTSAVFIWFIIIGLFISIIHVINNYGKIIRFVCFLLLILFLSLLILIDISSWKFFLFNQYFLTLNSLSFALINLSLLIKHIAESNLLLLILSSMFSVSFAAILLFAIQYILKKNDPMQHGKVIITIFSLVIMMFGISLFLQDNLYHPYFALFKKVNNYEKVPESEMMKYLYPKDNLISFDRTSDSNASIIVILIESMRRDLIHEEPSPIPNMKKLAKRSILFDCSYATSTHSDYSDISIWYSRYPLRKQNRLQASSSAEKGLSIFEYFHNSNYETAYISSQNENWGGMINWLKNKGINYFYHSEDHQKTTWHNEDDAMGLRKLIESNKATAGKIPDSETLEVAKKWLQNLEAGKNFFLGMNLQNTHYNYYIPSWGEEPFQPATMDFPAVYGFWPEAKAEIVKNRYFNAFYNLDHLIADFVSFLKQENFWQNSFFIIIGDNGEAFYEHGFANHSSELYDEASRTFTLIKTPDNDRQQIDESISHIDLLPTLLDLMKLPKPASFQGFSIFNREETRSVFIHNNALIQQDALVYWPWKYMKTNHPYKEQKLYNLETDPLEKNNLFQANDKIAKFMENRLYLISNVQLEYYKYPRYYMKYAPPRVY